jgi:hypothetical protein
MKIKLIIIGILLVNVGMGQSSYCPNDPPTNPWLADSPWPTYHRESYRQASTCLAGPIATDSLILKSKTNITGGTSPWMYISEPYPNGQKALYYSNATFVYKLVDNGTSIVTADSLRIDFDLLDFGWNFLLSKNKVWFTYDPKSPLSSNNTTALFKLTDADTTDVYSDIIVTDTLVFQNYGLGKIQTFGLNYSGQIVFNSENNADDGYATVGIIDQNFNILDTLHYPCTANEIVHHNAVAIDETNSFYVVTTKRMIRFDWDGSNVTKAWDAWYDFVGDGPTGTFAEGSGTTPTLIGWGNGNDKLVVVVDGHSNNNLVAFWRDLPVGWTGITGMDIRFADAITLPLATQINNTFQSVENSPCAFGYDIGVAQFNGFLGYDCTNKKGVQKIHWDTNSNQFSVAWQNNSININGVLTYAQGSNLVYGSGKEEDCNYYYYGLDWNNGNVVFKKLLGAESGVNSNDPYYDAGNNNIIDDNRNIYFPGGKSLIKLEYVANTETGVHSPESNIKIKIFPNPSTGLFNIEKMDSKIEIIGIYITDCLGRMTTYQANTNGIDLSSQPKGVYFISIQTKNGILHSKIEKH